jgi:hypothetical protein
MRIFERLRERARSAAPEPDRRGAVHGRPANAEHALLADEPGKILRLLPCRYTAVRELAAFSRGDRTDNRRDRLGPVVVRSNCSG